MERRLFPGDPEAASKLWLGEAWPETAAAGPAPDPPQARPPVPVPQPVLPRPWADVLREMFRSQRPVLAIPAGAEWLQEVGRTLGPDEAARPILTALSHAKPEQPVRVGFVGPVDSGKSATVKRLRVEAGQTAHAGPAVGVGPMTQRTAEYVAGRWELLDTCGMQSGNPAQESQTLDDLANAHLLICLLSPKLWTGQLDEIAALLLGSAARGLLPKSSRVLFLITQCDTYVEDPEENPEEYAQFCENKRAECLELLHRQGLDIRPEQILCASPDPFRTFGDRRELTAADYARFAAWDGFAAFTEALTIAAECLAEMAPQSLILETVLAGLVRLRDVAQAERSAVEVQIAEGQRQQKLVEEARISGEALADSMTWDAQRLLDAHVEPWLERIRDARSLDDLRAYQDQLEHWWTDEALRAEMEECQARDRKDVERWRRRVRRRLGRELGHEVKSTAAPPVQSAVSLPQTRWRDDPARVVSVVGHGGSLLFGAATYEATKRIGHLFAYKFRPYDIIKLSHKLQTTGRVIGAAGLLADGHALLTADAKEKERVAKRTALRAAVTESRDEVLQQMTAAERGGPLAVLRLCSQELGALSADLHRGMPPLTQARTRLADAIAGYERLLSQALKLLPSIPTSRQESP